MYPRPIPDDARIQRALYLGGVALVVILWLLPLLAVMLTSIRSNEELMAGNYWGWPQKFSLIENYKAVFEQTAMLRFFLNSLLITIPSVIGVLI
ncbi:MAG: carbohydrate ABC transporter permease, partial [Mesorhizobium sp.]